MNLREILEKIYGRIDRFKTKEELLDEEVEKFIAIHKPSADHVDAIANFLKAYIVDNEVRDIVESKQFSRFATSALVSMADYKQLGDWRSVIPEYVKDYVTLNRYM